MEGKLRTLSTTLSLFVIAAAIIVIAGWQFRVPAMKFSMLGTYVAPNTALCFLLSGISILLQLQARPNLQRIGVFFGAIVLIFGAGTLCEYVFGWDLGIDALFMSHRLSDWHLPVPGRFAFNSAVAFSASGFALVMLRRKTHIPFSELSAAGVLLVAYLSLVGYLYSASPLYNYVMAVHAAVLFLALGTAILCSTARTVVLQVVLTPYAGSIAARRMVFAVLILMPVFGLFRLEVGTNQLSEQVSTALLVVIAATVFAGLALHTGSLLNEADRKRRLSEAALIRTEKLATAGRMAATVAHEINNPLEAVGNLIYLLRTNHPDENTRAKYLELAEAELARVSSIARRTLGFYRDVSKPGEVLLSEIVDAVLELYQQKLTAEGITIHKKISSELPIVARRDEVRQIVDNLVANALDAVPKDSGLVELMIEASAGQVTLEIMDNGSGIENRNLSQIFEPFFTTKKELGTGLGLWVARELTSKNGGSIAVSSSTESGKQGTTFTLVFPAAQAKQAERTAGKSA